MHFASEINTVCMYLMGETGDSALEGARRNFHCSHYFLDQSVLGMVPSLQ
jgi:hypothetical protein